MSEPAPVAEAPIEVAPTPKPTSVHGQTNVEPAHVMAADMILAAAAGDANALAALNERAGVDKAARAEKASTVKPVEEEKPVSEVTEEAQAELEATETAKEEAEEAAQIESQEPGAKPDKGFRARFKDPEDVAIATIARTQGISLAKAAEIRAQITAKPVVVHQEAEEVIKPDPTIVAIEAEVEALRKQVRETKSADGLDESLPELEDQLLEARGRLREAACCRGYKEGREADQGGL